MRTISIGWITVLLLILAACVPPQGSSLRPPVIKLRNPGTIQLPRVFNKVWYRPFKKDFSFSAYESSGKLTVTEQGIVFETEDATLRIDKSEIHHVLWGKMPRDSFNDWAIVLYGDKASKTAAFKDGTGLGHGTDTDFILSTFKYAFEVKGDAKPFLYNPYASAWLDFTLGGMMGGKEGVFLAVGLKNRSENPIWVTVRFQSPGDTVFCKEAGKIQQNANHIFRCPVAKINESPHYPIYIAVYLDEGMSQLVEKTGARIQLPPNAINQMKKRVGKIQ